MKHVCIRNAHLCDLLWILWGFPGDADDKESPAMQETRLWSLEKGRFPGKGNGNPLQYSCLENSMARVAWWATVHGVSKVHPYWVATILKYCCWLFDQCPDDRAFLTDNKDKPGERGFSGIFQKGQIVTALWGSALWGVLQEPGRTGVAWVRSEVTRFCDISRMVH